MKSFNKFIFSAIVLAAALPANAIFDLRLGLSANSGDPSNMNSFLSDACSCNVKSTSIPGTGVDAIVKIPLIPFGFGLRYEQFGTKAEQANVVKASFTYNRTALLLNYRILSNLIYLGPIFTYGIADSSKFKYEDFVNNLSYDLTASSTSSYTAGLEGGVNLGIIIVGAEVGMGSIKAKGYKTSGGAVLTSPGGIDFDTLDYTGTYAKLHVGIGF